MTESKTLSDLRIRLGGVECDAFGGDNISVFLASEFERHVEGDEPEMDEYDTWPQEAVDKANEVLDAIHAAYTPAIEAQAAEIERLREADKAVASAGLLLSRAFNRIHCLPRTSDTELAQAIGEWRRDYIDRPWKAARAALSGDDHE